MRWMIMIIVMFLAGCSGSSGERSVVSHNMEEAMFNVAMAAEKAQNYAYAADVYKKALNLNPKSIKIMRRLAYCYAASKQFHKSLKTYESIRRILPMDADATLGLAENYLALQDYAAAMHTYQHGWDEKILQQRLSKTYNGVGIVLDRFHFYPMAQVCYKKGLAVEPNRHSIASNLAMSEALSGQLQPAMARLQQALLSQRTPRVL